MSNTAAQDLATIALSQQSALDTGVLSTQVFDPTTYYPKRPWIDEPSGSNPFDQQGAALLAGVVGETFTVLTLLVPQGFDGVIKYLSCNATFPFNDFSGDLQWQLLQNGRAIRNFDNILAQKGTIQIPRPISPLRIYSGDTITWVINHIANAALNGNVVCTLNGYFYPIQGLS